MNSLFEDIQLKTLRKTTEIQTVSAGRANRH